MKNERLTAVCGAQRRLGCMANVSGELLATGEVSFTRNVPMPAGALPGYGGPDPVVPIAHGQKALAIASLSYYFCINFIGGAPWSN